MHGQDQRVTLSFLFIEGTNEQAVDLYTVPGCVANDFLRRQSQLLKPRIAGGQATRLCFPVPQIEHFVRMPGTVADEGRRKPVSRQRQAVQNHLSCGDYGLASTAIELDRSEGTPHPLVAHVHDRPIVLPRDRSRIAEIAGQ